MPKSFARFFPAAGVVLLLITASMAALRVQGQSAAPSRLVTREDLIGGPWDFRSTALPGKVFTGVWTFDKDKTLSKGTGPKSEWSLRGKTLRVEHENNNWQVFSLESPSTGGALVMKEVDSSAGKREGITLTQVKK